MIEVDWQQYWADLDLDDDVWRARILDTLPAMQSQDEGGTNQAVLNVIADRFIAMLDNFKRIYELRLLDNQEGKTLEDTAADWGVHRIDDDDDFLRFEVRLAWMLNRIGVTENDMIDLIAFILQCDPTEFDLITDPKELGGDPEAFKLVNVPNKYSKSARKKALLVKSLRGAVMPEVRLDSVAFQAEADQNLYIATAAFRNLQHYAVSDERTNRLHDEDAGRELVVSVVQKRRSHRAIKEA